MAIPTTPEIKALNLGYLTGADVLQYINLQVITNRLSIDSNSLFAAAQDSYEEIKAHLATKYDIESELLKTGSNRYRLTVNLCAVLTVQRLVASMAGIPETTREAIKWAHDTILAIRNGQLSLLLVKQSSDARSSVGEVIKGSFYTLG